MALFAGIRDTFLIKSLNKELLGNIITQQASFYKFEISKTKTNLYGEAVGGKFYSGPILFNCLIERQPQAYTDSDKIMNIDFTWPIVFKFFKDDLEQVNVVPEIGDILLYQERYWEINNVTENTYFGGKNPEYPNNINPLNPGLENFGLSVAIICNTHYVPADKVGISLERLI
jgi:hypothetical protein